MKELEEERRVSVFVRLVDEEAGKEWKRNDDPWKRRKEKVNRGKMEEGIMKGVCRRE